MVLSLRDDFLMRCHGEAPLAAVFSELTPLGSRSRSGLRRALVEPASSAGTASRTRRSSTRWWTRRGRAGGAAVARVRRVALWELRDREQEAAHTRGLSIDRRRRRCARAACGGDARSHRPDAAGPRARAVPQPDDRAGHPRRDRARRTAVGVPRPRGRRDGAARAGGRPAAHVVRGRGKPGEPSRTSSRSRTSRCSRRGRGWSGGRRRTRTGRCCAIS